jgi:hypothetical protein
MFSEPLAFKAMGDSVKIDSPAGSLEVLAEKEYKKGGDLNHVLFH